MRRKDKEIKDKSEIEEILSSNQICSIALSEENQPYIVTMNYAYRDNQIFLHSAPEGKKIDMMRKNGNVCFKVADSVKVLGDKEACKFRTRYRSVIVFGQISFVTDLHEKEEALQLIMEQNTDSRDWEFNNEKIKRVAILRIKIKSIAGKKSAF